MGVGGGGQQRMSVGPWEIDARLWELSDKGQGPCLDFVS